MKGYCKNCGSKITTDDEFCPDCGSRIESDMIACKNCGQKIHKDVKFCNYCGQPAKEIQKFCPNCGNELEANEDFCSECGTNLSNHSKESFLDKFKKDKKLIIALVAVIALLLVGAVLLSGSPVDREIPLETMDFTVVSMLVPEGSYFVETNSLPAYGNIGGFVTLENAGNYSYDVFSIMFSTIEGGSDAPLEDVSLDRVDGDIHIYKDKKGEDKYYITRQVGEYKIDVIGSNEDAIVKMLKSAKVTSTTQLD